MNVVADVESGNANPEPQVEAQATKASRLPLGKAACRECDVLIYLHFIYTFMAYSQKTVYILGQCMCIYFIYHILRNFLNARPNCI